MSDLLTIIFQTNPGNYFPRVELYVGAFSLLVLLAIALFIFLRASSMPTPLKRSFQNIPMWLLSFAVLGFMVVFFRLSAVPILSMRLWFIVLFALFIWWAVVQVLRLKKELPEKMALIKKKQEKAKDQQYKPVRKKRSKRK